MPDDAMFTPAQDDAIKNAFTLLSEHFEHVLIVVDSSIDHEGQVVNAHECWWYGGSMSAIGLAEYARHRILNSGKKGSDPRDSGDD